MTNLSAEAERLRAEILRTTDPAFAAEASQKAMQDRRFFNSKINRAEIARYKELLASIEQNNAQLIAFGDTAVDVEEGDPLDLRTQVLRGQIDLLDRVILQQMDRLDHLRARAAARDREIMIAKETPIERRFRLLEERADAAESRLANLERDVTASERAQQFVPPVRPKPQMSGMGTLTGTGLCPEAMGPPVTRR